MSIIRIGKIFGVDEGSRGDMEDIYDNFTRLHKYGTQEKIIAYMCLSIPVDNNTDEIKDVGLLVRNARKRELVKFLLVYYLVNQLVGCEVHIDVREFFRKNIFYSERGKYWKEYIFTIDINNTIMISMPSGFKFTKGAKKELYHLLLGSHLINKISEFLYCRCQNLISSDTNDFILNTPIDDLKELNNCNTLEEIITTVDRKQSDNKMILFKDINNILWPKVKSLTTIIQLNEYNALLETHFYTTFLSLIRSLDPYGNINLSFFHLILKNYN